MTDFMQQFKQFLCRHRSGFDEQYFALRASRDDPTGPQTYHGIRFVCRRCGKIVASYEAGVTP